MSEGERRDAIARVATKARAYFDTDATLPRPFRIDRLRALENAIQAHEGAILDAVREDMGRAFHEAYPSEIAMVEKEIRHALKHLKAWMKPERRSVPSLFWPARGFRYPEPIGTVLILAPWNYPFQLATEPLVSAIAAGCTAVLKPSELAPASAQVVESCLSQAFGDDGYVSVVQGDKDVGAALLEQQWDLIFFTGSTRVGQLVHAAASRQLTPCVLELGGKSPCIVDRDADVTVAARRILWGKCYNAGQSCVAPDYVLVHRDIEAALLEQMSKVVRDFYGRDPSQSPDYARIINEAHFHRLQSLMSGGRVVIGGQTDQARSYIAPTVLTDVDLEHPLMQEEIFGPLLPVVSVDDVDAAVSIVRARPKPLALYVFTSSSATAERVLERTTSGGAVVNDTIIQVPTVTLPFGGVGGSGLGAYHGRAGFEAFSHYKSVIKKPYWADLKVRYPPYGLSLNVLKRLTR